jgi:transposase-like protein
MDETYIKVAGRWKYLYCAVDQSGGTVDSLRTAMRDLAAARRYLERAINLHDLPEKVCFFPSPICTQCMCVIEHTGFHSSHIMCDT